MDTIQLLANHSDELKIFIEKLRNLNVNPLNENEKERYFTIVNKYEKILNKILLYIIDQKPIFKILLDRTESGNPDNCEILFHSIDFNTSKILLEELMNLENDIKNLEQIIRSKCGAEKWNIIVNGFLSISLVAGGILISILTIATGGNAVPIIGSIFGLFSTFSGFASLGDTIEGTIKYNKINKIHKQINEIIEHLKNIKDSETKLNCQMIEFKYKIKMRDKDFISNIEMIYKELEILEKIVLNKNS